MSIPTYYGQLQRRIAGERNDRLRDSCRNDNSTKPLIHWAMVGDEPAGMCWDGDCYPDIAQTVSIDINEVTCPECRTHFRTLNDLKKVLEDSHGG